MRWAWCRPSRSTRCASDRAPRTSRAAGGRLQQTRVRVQRVQGSRARSVCAARDPCKWPPRVSCAVERIRGVCGLGHRLSALAVRTDGNLRLRGTRNAVDVACATVWHSNVACSCTAPAQRGQGERAHTCARNEQQEVSCCEVCVAVCSAGCTCRRSRNGVCGGHVVLRRMGVKTNAS